MDVSRSLARQSVVVAVVAAVIDTLVLGVCGIFAVAPWQTGVVLAGILVADLALAGPPRSAGAVALIQVALRFLAAILLHRHGFPVRFADVGFLVAGYRAGAWLTGPESVCTVLAMSAGVATANIVADSTAAHDWRMLVATTVAGGCVPWLVGRYTAARSAYIADLEQRARLRDQEHRAALDRAVTDERAAIARDLHDVISHHVSAIGIHAGAARMALADTENPAATRSLTAVEASSRAAMIDLRRQLDLLHGHEDDGQRQPGLADIDGLLERVRAAGLNIELSERGSAVPLPDSLNITLYRIVQEMLTNALRHGDGENARLTVRYRPDRIVVESENPLSGTPAETGSQVPRGLAGIRRRVELFDGELDYGVTGKRWRITVSMPIGGL
ncbi:sensor histidine kinase [Nocardia arthritidis]|uniref:histidine kinase n=1 Tax=Nocardia arthritidis TaxID=228602 RepID=A0A6G9YPQ0_9NOCA|nr:histidine kinase [Nocardia arthritidis]QIS15100.1 histidine kinase [Nocardia arthritidis]